MTYSWFLCLFLILPIIVLSLLLRHRLLNKHYWLATGLLFIPVLCCMAPWDHTAVANGIWNWTPEQTWGMRVWLIPLEEYLFALLQTTLATMLLYSISLWQRSPQRKLRALHR